jgi:hypothetical protein
VYTTAFEPHAGHARTGTVAFTLSSSRAPPRQL